MYTIIDERRGFGAVELTLQGLLAVCEERYQSGHNLYAESATSEGYHFIDQSPSWASTVVVSP
jgi:hypothetical protein